MEYPMCTQSVKRKEFLVQLAYKRSSFFNRKFRLIRVFYFQKFRNFIGSRKCSNRTKLGMEYPMFTQSVKEKSFGIAWLGKKFVFQSEISAYSVIIRLFYFQKDRNFIGSRSCPNRTNHGMEYPMCAQRVKRKEFLVQLVYKRSSFFNRKFRLIRLFYFRKYRNFIESRSCPNRIKLGVEYPMCTQSVKRKRFLVQLFYKKVHFSIGNFDLFGYSIFKNIEILSGQGVVQIEPTTVWSIPCVPRA